jgi:hypothetical protein
MIILKPLHSWPWRRTSYFSYLRPIIIYPLPWCALTSAQCCFIQVPAFVALLPKLHLNRHSPHKVLIAGDKYGGLNLPNLYVDQGYGQLTLLIAHLKLEDDTGKLIFPSSVTSSYMWVQLHQSSNSHSHLMPNGLV